MKKNLILILVSISVALLIAEFVLRMAGFPVADYKRNNDVTKPDSLIVFDKALAWRLSAGEFTFFRRGTAHWSCTINSKGNRITSKNELLRQGREIKDSAPKINLYGCSYTFGQSLPDSCTYPYYLQSMLHGYHVRNEGAMGYGPVQMYISLVNDVNAGDKPDVAVINYAYFHDDRTVLSRNWMSGMKETSINDNKPGYREVVVPYARLVTDDSIAIEYLKWKDWPVDLPFCDKSALINLINISYNKLNQYRHRKEYARVNLLCLYRILGYCRQSGIAVMFYGLDSESKPKLDSLAAKGAVTSLSSVDINVKGYNCSPFDPNHPNAKATNIYAHEVFDCLAANHMIHK